MLTEQLECTYATSSTAAAAVDGGNLSNLILLLSGASHWAMTGLSGGFIRLHYLYRQPAVAEGGRRKLSRGTYAAVEIIALQWSRVLVILLFVDLVTADK